MELDGTTPIPSGRLPSADMTNSGREIYFYRHSESWVQLISCLSPVPPASSYTRSCLLFECIVNYTPGCFGEYFVFKSVLLDVYSS